jgi:hypothetical protein
MTSKELFKAFCDPSINNEDIMISIVQAGELMALIEENTLNRGRSQERNETVCRLLASDMSAEEVSVILKIHVNEVQEAEKYSSKKINEYAKTLKGRRKYRVENRR